MRCAIGVLISIFNPTQFSPDLVTIGFNTNSALQVLNPFFIIADPVITLPNTGIAWTYATYYNAIVGLHGVGEQLQWITATDAGSLIDAINLTASGTIDGTASGSNSSVTSVSCTLTTVGTSDVIIVYVECSHGLVPTISDGSSLTWKQRGKSTSATYSGSTTTLYEFYAVASSALSSDVITATVSSTATSMCILAFGVKNANVSNPFNVPAPLANSVNSPNTAEALNTAIISTTGETLIIAAWGGENSSSGFTTGTFNLLTTNNTWQGTQDFTNNVTIGGNLTFNDVASMTLTFNSNAMFSGSGNSITYSGFSGIYFDDPVSISSNLTVTGYSWIKGKNRSYQQALTASTTTSTSATLLGTSMSFTPSFSGYMVISAIVRANNNTIGDGVVIGLYQGATSGALTTLLDSETYTQEGLASNSETFVLHYELSGQTVGTATYISLAFNAVTGGTASAKIVSLSVQEI